MLQAGGWWYVYYDEYTRGKYGAVRTKDFVTLRAVSRFAQRSARHAARLGVPGAAAVLRRHLALDSSADVDPANMSRSSPPCDV